MNRLFKMRIDWVLVVSVVFSAGCENAEASEADRRSSDEALVVVSMDVLDGTAEGLTKQQSISAAEAKLGGSQKNARSAAVTVSLENFHADYRDKHERFEWCIGGKITLEIFDGRSIVVLNKTIREQGDSYGWSGSIVEGGSGLVSLFVSPKLDQVTGEILLYNEGRKILIAPTDSPDTHLLYEPRRTYSPDAPSDMARRSTGDRLADLERARDSLEADLRVPNQPREYYDGTQLVLDGILERIENEKARRAAESVGEGKSGEPEASLKQQPATQTPSLGTPVVRVLVVHGSNVSNPQAEYTTLKSQVEELFITNSHLDVDFEYVSENPIRITIPGETTLTSEAILLGVEDGDYKTVDGTPTADSEPPIGSNLRDIHAADLVLAIRNNSGIPGDCGLAEIGLIPANDSTGFGVMGTVCNRLALLFRAHEVGHNFGAGHEAEPGTYSDSRAFVVPGTYQTVMTSAFFNLVEVPLFSQQGTPPPPIEPTGPVGDDGHENIRAVEALPPIIESYRVAAPSPPPRPQWLDIRPDFCFGWNLATWEDVSGEDFYELRRSTTLTGTKFLVYSGTTTNNVKFNAPSESYMWVRACNTGGCSNYRQGDRQSHYFPRCQ